MKKFFVKLCYSLLLLALLLTPGKVFAQVPDSSSINKLFPPNSDKVIPSLNFKDADMRDVFRGLAVSYETNILVDNRIQQRISVALYNVTVFDAIKMITEDNGFVFAYDKNRFFIKIKSVEKAAPPKEPVSFCQISYDNLTDKVDLRLENVSLQKLMLELQQKTNKNFLLNKGAQGNVTGSLQNMDIEIALKNILLNNGFYFTKKDSIYYISRSSYFSTISEPGKLKGQKYWVSATNIDNVAIDVTDVELNQIVDDLSNQLNLQLIKLVYPTSKVTVKCFNLPVEKAFYYLFKGTEFSFIKEKEAYIIGERKNSDLKGLKLYRLKHLKAENVNKQLPKELFKEVHTDVSVELNAIIISGSHEGIINLEQYLELIDNPVPQVTIEALVVDYNLDNMYQFGVTAGTGDSLAANRPDQWFPGFDITASGNKVNNILKDIGSVNFFGKNLNVGKLGNLPKDFYMNLKMMEQDGVANIKSRPILSTLNGHTASLKIGTVQNYVFKDVMPITSQVNATYLERERVEKIEASIYFEITPWVGPNGELTLDIKPEFQTPVGQFSPDKNLIPAINTRVFESTVKLRDGETIVLGGLIQETESSTENKVPILGDIPILGKLFTSTSKKTIKGELIIYLTPKIFYEKEFGYEKLEYARNIEEE